MYNEKMYLGSGIADPADPEQYNVNDPNIIVDKLPLGETSGRVLMTNAVKLLPISIDIHRY